MRYVASFQMQSNFLEYNCHLPQPLDCDWLEWCELSIFKYALKKKTQILICKKGNEVYLAFFWFCLFVFWPFSAVNSSVLLDNK